MMRKRDVRPPDRNADQAVLLVPGRRGTWLCCFDASRDLHRFPSFKVASGDYGEGMMRCLKAVGLEEGDFIFGPAYVGPMLDLAADLEPNGRIEVFIGLLLNIPEEPEWFVPSHGTLARWKDFSSPESLREACPVHLALARQYRETVDMHWPETGTIALAIGPKCGRPAVMSLPHVATSTVVAIEHQPLRGTSLTVQPVGEELQDRGKAPGSR